MRTWCAIVAVSLTLTACGASGRQDMARGIHATLNAVTDAVDPAYGLAVVACDTREGLIVARQGTTQAQDQADMSEVRSQCDSLFDGFETIRQAQEGARAAADIATSSDTPEALAHALELLQNVYQGWQTVRHLLSEGWFAELIGAHAEEGSP